MGIEMNSMSTRNIKLFAAVVGGIAMVALGAMSAAIPQQSISQDMAVATRATVGAVTSWSPAPAGPVEEAVMKAAPEIRARPHRR
jgi:hypothetical protein